MILPFSGMQIATAEQPEKNNKASKTVEDYEFVKGKIAEQIQTEEKIKKDKDASFPEKNRANKEIQRLHLTDKLADLKIKIINDPDNAEKYADNAMKIFEKLDALYGLSRTVSNSSLLNHENL